MNFRLLIVSLVFIVMMFSISQGAEKAADAVPLPNEFQKLAPSISAALIRSWTKKMEHLDTEQELRETLDELPTTDRNLFVHYINQVLAASYDEENPNNDSIDQWAVGLMAASTPRDLLLDAIVPSLAPKESLHEILTKGDKELYEYIEYITDLSGPSIQEYIAYIQRHGYDKSQYLTEYLADKYFEESLFKLIDISSFADTEKQTLKHRFHLTLAFVTQPEDEKSLIPEEVWYATLVDLSQHKAWWVRFYLANLVESNKKLQVPDVMGRLRNDPNELVRGAIQNDKK